MFKRQFPGPIGQKAPVQNPHFNQMNHVAYPSYEPTHTPFTYYAKPKQPEHWFPSTPNYYNNPEQVYYHQEDAFQYENNDPNHSFPDSDATEDYAGQSQGSNPFLSQFQNADGKMDVDKMLNMVGQFANTYHQVAPIVKEVSSLVKVFR